MLLTQTITLDSGRIKGLTLSSHQYSCVCSILAFQERGKHMERVACDALAKDVERLYIHLKQYIRLPTMIGGGIMRFDHDLSVRNYRPASPSERASKRKQPQKILRVIHLKMDDAISLMNHLESFIIHMTGWPPCWHP